MTSQTNLIPPASGTVIAHTINDDCSSSPRLQQLELPGIEEVPPSPKEEEFTRLSKTRHKRRLQDRWRCKTKGHSYCFTDADLLHDQLTEDNLDEWVNAIHNGYATLLAPPQCMVPSQSLRLESDANSVRSTTSRNTITHQRPFRFQLNPSLSDIRSWHSSVSASSASSGIPGPGYLSGKVIKWIGEKILDAYTPLEIRRRMWVIGRLMKRLEKEPEETRWKWLLQREKSVNRLVDDLLELSKDDYKRKYREASIAHGSHINNSLARSNYDNEGVYWLLSSRISPLVFLGEDKDSALSSSLREILLQESMQASDADRTVSELVAYACRELTYGVSTKSRHHTFELIQQLYFVPAGARELERLGRPGGLLDNLAKKVFDDGFEHYREQWSAVQFFAEYANDHPAFRKYVLGPNGLSLNLRMKIFGPANINGQIQPASTDWAPISWPCRTIGRISDIPWLIPALLDLDICHAIVQLLFSHKLSGRPDVRIDYSIVRTFRNLIVIGDGPARRAVHDALTEEVIDVLRNLGEITWDIVPMATDVRKWITEIFRDGDDRTKTESPNARKVTFDLRFRVPGFEP